MKKLLSIVLALVMVLTFMVPAFAEGTTVVYYVNGAIDGDAVAATAGETYTPDRMPTTAAPDGQYFAGWKYNGNFVVDAITVAEGENRLEAVYKDRVSGTVNADLTIANLPVKLGTTSAQVLVPSIYDSVYQGYALRNGWAPTAYTTDGTDSYIRHYNNVTWGQSTIQYIHDEEGSVFVAKPETTYKIIVDFRVPQNASTASTEGAKPGFKMYVDVGWNPSIRNSPNSNNATASSAYKASAETYSVWHDHGPCRPFWSDVDETEWTTETFTITTKTLADYESAGLLPIFTYHISHPGTSVPTELHVRSITIKEVAATVNYYVGNEVVKTINSLGIGSTFVPDLVPEAPEGKYFAGWKDAEGNYVLDDGMTLVADDNNLYASFIEYPGKGTSWGTYTWAKGKKFSAPYTNTSGEFEYYATHGTWLNYWTKEYEGETVFQAYNGNTWGTTSYFLVPNADGSVMQVEPGKTYNVTVTYMNPLGTSHSINFGGGLREDLIANNGTTTQGMAKSVGSLKEADDAALSGTREWVYTLSSGGHLQWIINTTTTEWTTATFSITMAADLTGYVPVLFFAGGVAASSGFYIKDITVADANWVEPTTVAYYVNGVQEGETIKLENGATYAPDRMPTAEAPEGKYFAGWKYNGEYVVDAITLTTGENKLVAEFKEYASGTITADVFNNTLPKTTGGAAKVLMPSVVDGVYWGYADNKGWAAATDTTENGESFVRIGSAAEWGQHTAQFIHNSDGTVLYAKPSTTYKIELTYKIGAYPETDTTTYAAWKAASDANDGTANSLRPNLSMYMNVGFLPSKRTGLGNTTCLSGSECAIASSLKATAQEHHTWFDHGPGLGIWKDVAGDGWVTEIFMITTKDAATYEQYGLIPAFWFGVNSGRNTYKVDVKSIVVAETGIADKLQDATIAEKAVGYVKVLDEVEDNTTYKVTFNGNLTADNIGWSSVYALTANADNVNLNQSLIYGYNADHGVYDTMGSFGHDWVQTYTSFITTDLVAEEGNALYLYVTNVDLLAALNLISVEKVDAIANEGAAILVDQPADATQAIRYFFSYNTVNGDDIVIDGKTYKIASRGFLLADADKVGDKIVTRTTAAEENSGIIDANTTDLTKCWNYTDNGDGTVNLQFSTYVKGFKADEGTYNNTNRLYVKGYVVLENGSVIYVKETTDTVADIANELGLVG